MKVYVLTLVFLICTIQMNYSQETDGVVALALPIRNSLTFNQYAINPTFSFVRQQNKYLSISNKREWSQFEDAPQTYLASFSGRFKENIGVGVAAFQQNYGVLTTFGGLLNFAYNARLDRDSNLTFGLNIGAYKSGLNSGKVVTNFPDPSLDNIPSNFMLTVNPGINYGTGFIDFGVSINNLVLYNFNTSELIQENPEQAIQGHIMYTGYLESNGFFDESKFSGLIRSEFKKEKTVISGLLMLTVPKGIWAQAGYNNVYGASAGIGLNITKEIAVEYNFEKALGDLTDFGPSHEITLAYRFKNNDNYDYSGEDEISGLISTDKKIKPLSDAAKAQGDANRQLSAENKAQAKIDAEAKAEAKAEAVAQAKLDAEAKAQADAAEKLAASQAKEAAAKVQAEAQAKLDAAAKVQADLAKIEADKLAKEVAAAKEKIATEKALAQVKLAAEAKTKADAEAKAKLEAERIAEANRIKVEAQTQAKIAAETKVREAAEAKARLEAEKLAAANAEALRLAEATRLKAENDAQAKIAAENKLNDAAEAEAQRLAETVRLKAEADAQAKIIADAKALADAESMAAAENLKAEAQAKLNQEQLATEAEAKRLADEAKAKEALAAQAAQKDALKVTPTDAIAKSMGDIEAETKVSETRLAELLSQYTDAIANKNKDLKDLKEENDLSDKGIVMAPKPFKSLTEENNAMNALKAELDETIDTRNDRIKQLENLYEQRLKIVPLVNDEVNLYYQKAIKKLKAEQASAIAIRTSLTSNLADIAEATEIERKRRIKRAAFDSEEDKYQQDRAALSIIKQNTNLATVPLKAEDFDFGQEQNGNIQILKNVKHVDNAYYMIVAVHNDVAKRDDFIRKAVAAGRNDIDFFYDVNTSKYYIYYQKFESIEEANEALKAKGNRPYNVKMSLVKIEN